MPEDQVVVIEETILVDVVNQDFPITPQEDVTIVEVAEETVSVISVAEQGPPGRDGIGTDYYESFSESTQWVVNHNLGRIPIPTMLTPGGAVLDTLWINTNLNQFIVYFTFPTAGSVRCL